MCPEIWPFRTPIKGYNPIDLNQKIGAILMFHGSQDWGRDIQIVCDLLRTNGDLKAITGESKIVYRPHEDIHNVSSTRGNQLPIYFSNSDFIWSNSLPLTRFAQGSFRHVLELTWKRLSGGQDLGYTKYGKPEILTYQYAERAIEVNARHLLGSQNVGLEEMGGFQKRMFYGIGDNLESDIEGANRAGWRSVLVKTGVYEGGPHEAKFLVEDVEEAVELILSNR
ncbi:UNVERIFIED_CONTAM: Haloacid dehalogenase-like hydrolase domain-containing 5, partial [Siphonaria sp. JEL0065]